MRACSGPVWALGLALALAVLSADAAMAPAVAHPYEMGEVEEVMAPAPGFDRSQKFRLPQRPGGEWNLAAASAPQAQSQPAGNARIVAAPAAAEQVQAPGLSPKYQLPGRPRNGDFAATLSAMLADYQGHPMPMPPAQAVPYAAIEQAAASPTGSPGFSRDPRLILPPRPTEEWRPVPISNLTREEAVTTGFVTTSGTNFVLDGKIIQFAGNNGYFVILRCHPILVGFQICDSASCQPSCRRSLSSACECRAGAT